MVQRYAPGVRPRRRTFEVAAALCFRCERPLWFSHADPVLRCQRPLCRGPLVAGRKAGAK